jgi:hypothetical protein
MSLSWTTSEYRRKSTSSTSTREGLPLDPGLCIVGIRLYQSNMGFTYIIGEAYLNGASLSH